MAPKMASKLPFLILLLSFSAICRGTEETTGATEVPTSGISESIQTSPTLANPVSESTSPEMTSSEPTGPPGTTPNDVEISSSATPKTSTDLPLTTETRNNDGSTEEPSTTESTSPETTTEEELSFINILDTTDKKSEESASKATTSPEQPTTPSEQDSSTPTPQTRKQKLSDQIRAVIAHYKKFGTVTIPDASVPDPMDIPSMKKNIGGSEIVFSNTKVYGLSNFTIEHVNTDLDKMQVYVAIYMTRLVTLGNYSTKVFFRKAAGPFNVTLLYVEASGAAALVRDEEGNLQASESEMDMTFMESKVKFGNMGLMGTLLQGVVASAGPVLFDSIKPHLLTEINNKVRADVNNKIKTVGSKFAQSGNKPPLDIALEEGRKYVRENGYDPYYIENYMWKYMPKNESVFKVDISRLVLTGLSNFRRVGEVGLSMDSGTVQMSVHLATSKLKGKCFWAISLGKYGKNGHTNFTVDYVQGRGIVNQSLDVSKHPVLEDLDINVGKVKIQMRGTGPFDFIIEAVVNTLPDLIRHMIVDAIELPLKFALQQILQDIKVEDILEKQLPELDKMDL